MITEATLRDFFEHFGEIQQIVIRKHELTEDGRQHGFAFLTFVHHSTNEQAIELVRKHLVAEILYDCAWSKQYLDSMRKEQAAQQMSSSASDSAGVHSPFKAGSNSYAPTPIGVSRAGSLDFFEQTGAHQAEAAMRNNFYTVGSGTPLSMSFDAYDSTVAGSSDSRWIAPANSMDQSNMDGVMGRRAETPGGHLDASGAGIAFSKLSISSPSPNSMSFDRQDGMGHHLQVPGGNIPMRNVPTPPTPPSQQQINNRAAMNAFPPKQSPYQGMEQSNARFGGIRKQTSAPQHGIEQMQRRHGGFNGGVDTQQPQAFPHQGLSSWSADMMDDYSSAMRVNHMHSGGIPTMHVPNAKIRSSEMVNNGRQSHNTTQFSPSPQLQQLQQSPYSNQNNARSMMQPQGNFNVHANHANVVMSHGHMNGSVQGNYPHHRPPSASPHMHTPNYSVQTHQSVYSPSLTTSAPGTSNTAYNRGEHHSFSPQHPNLQSGIQHGHFTPNNNRHPTGQHAGNGVNSANRVDEMMQRAQVYSSPYTTSPQVKMNNNQGGMANHSFASTPQSRIMTGMASLSHDDFDTSGPLGSQQGDIAGYFAQFSPSPADVLGVPRTQSESAIGASPAGPQNGLYPSVQNEQGRQWIPSPGQQPSLGGALPPRGYQQSPVYQSSSSNHPFLSGTSHVANSAGHQSMGRNYSGSDTASANNSFHNSFDEYDGTHGVHSGALPNGHGINESNSNSLSAADQNSNVHFAVPISTSANNTGNNESSLNKGASSSRGLELSFMTYDHNAPASAVSSTSAMSTPAGVPSQRSIEDLIMCDDLLASNSHSKDPEAVEHANHSSISLFSLSDSSSPRLDGGRIPSLSSFSIETTGKPTPNARVQSLLLLEDPSDEALSASLTSSAKIPSSFSENPETPSDATHTNEST